MYEIEYKVEITESEREKLTVLLVAKGFDAKPAIKQKDFYIEAAESPLGGFNLRRYRDEGDRVFYTEKIWEDINGEKFRKEIEREISREEFTLEIKKYPNAMKIVKERFSFFGTYEDNKIHVDLDTVKFDHSPTVRYFIEAEVMSDNRKKVKSLRQLVISFLKESLGMSHIQESPGMFTMAFKRL
jgi:adenylate cyclase class IV